MGDASINKCKEKRGQLPALVSGFGQELKHKVEGNDHAFCERFHFTSLCKEFETILDRIVRRKCL